MVVNRGGDCHVGWQWAWKIKNEHNRAILQSSYEIFFFDSLTLYLFNILDRSLENKVFSRRFSLEVRNMSTYSR